MEEKEIHDPEVRKKTFPCEPSEKKNLHQTHRQFHNKKVKKWGISVRILEAVEWSSNKL